MLLEQRRAVAAASVRGGAGDFDLTLILAGGCRHGMADPAVAAWYCWLQRDALQALIGHALQRIVGTESPWAWVTGPAAAFVASARRLGWVVRDAAQVLTDQGVLLDFTRDSPAFVQGQVSKSVWRWR